MHSTRPRDPDLFDQAAPEVQPEDAAAQPSAQVQIRQLAAGVVLGLSPLPAAIPIRPAPKIARARSKRLRIASPRPEESTSRPLAGHGQTGVQARTQAEQTRVFGRTSARQPGDSGTADQSPCKDSGTGSLRLRKGRQEALRGLRQGRGRRGQGIRGWWELRNDRNELPIDIPTPLRALDPWPRTCPRCRRRTRQYKGVDRRSGDRLYRMLCAPCAREVRLRERDRRCFSEKPIKELDRPAPLCPLCCRRPRANKGTQRGKRRYARLCDPCTRRDREQRGLPAYRGKKGARFWLREKVTGRPRRTLHRRGRPLRPRPEWLTESFFETPDPADRPRGDRGEPRTYLSIYLFRGLGEEENTHTTINMDPSIPAAPTAPAGRRAAPPPLAQARPKVAHARAGGRHCAVKAYALWMNAPGARRVHEGKPARGRRGAGKWRAMRSSRGPPRRGPPRHARRRRPARGAIGVHAPLPRSLSASARGPAAPEPTPLMRRPCSARGGFAGFHGSINVCPAVAQRALLQRIDERRPRILGTRWLIAPAWPMPRRSSA